MSTKEYLDAESFVAGVVTIVTEFAILVRLRQRSRIQWYYHVFPFANGVLLLTCIPNPNDVAMRILSFALTIVTSMNVYNTLIPNVDSTYKYMIVEQPTIVQDILLPRYTTEFYPWGACLQFAYSLMVLAHVWAQSLHLAHTLQQM